MEKTITDKQFELVEETISVYQNDELIVECIENETILLNDRRKVGKVIAFGSDVKNVIKGSEICFTTFSKPIAYINSVPCFLIHKSDIQLLWNK